jgi:hypothetical protein
VHLVGAVHLVGEESRFMGSTSSKPQTPRQETSAARRLNWHTAQMASAGTSRARLWAALSWLVAEAVHADGARADGAQAAVEEMTERVLSLIHEIREEPTK